MFLGIIQNLIGIEPRGRSIRFAPRDALALRGVFFADSYHFVEIGKVQ